MTARSSFSRWIGPHPPAAAGCGEPDRCAGRPKQRFSDFQRINVLRHAEILREPIETAATRWLNMPMNDCFIFSETEGLIETCKDLGEPVRHGEVLARVYPVEKTGSAPQEYRASLDGVLAARHFPGLVKSGDCIAVIGCIEPK